nr:MAG TPA: hypothetical protein [Caudoviricetes sp.]
MKILFLFHLTSTLECLNWIRRLFSFLFSLLTLNTFLTKSTTNFKILHFSTIWTLTIQSLNIIKFSSKFSSLNLLLLHFL